MYKGTPVEEFCCRILLLQSTFVMNGVAKGTFSMTIIYSQPKIFSLCKKWCLYEEVKTGRGEFKGEIVFPPWRWLNLWYNIWLAANVPFSQLSQCCLATRKSREGALFLCRERLGSFCKCFLFQMVHQCQVVLL